MALDGTYAGLQASIAALIRRNDCTAVIPDWIKMAEAALNRKFVQAGGLRPMVQRVDANLAAEFSVLPSDFKGMRSIYLTEDRTRPLRLVKSSVINQFKNTTLSLTGKPFVFAIVGTTLQLFRAPDESYPAEMTYVQAIPPLSSGDNNWLITTHPDLYLYASALHSAPLLKADERLEMWGTLAEQIAEDVIEANKIEEDAPDLETYQTPGYTP